MHWETLFTLYAISGLVIVTYFKVPTILRYSLGLGMEILDRGKREITNHWGR